jgi:hypothetical protein
MWKKTLQARVSGQMGKRRGLGSRENPDVLALPDSLSFSGK